MKFSRYHILGALFILFVVGGWLVYRSTGKRNEGFENVTGSSTDKTMNTVTEKEMTALDSHGREGDAMDLSLEGQSGVDMPRREQIGHYRQGSDIVDDFYGDTRDLTSHGLDLTDVSTYRQEVTSSQLAMQAIQHPYYEMNLSNVIRGTILPRLDPRTSRHGPEDVYVIKQVPVTPPIINMSQEEIIREIGNAGRGGVDMQ